MEPEPATGNHKTNRTHRQLAAGTHRVWQDKHLMPSGDSKRKHSSRHRRGEAGASQHSRHNNKLKQVGAVERRQVGVQRMRSQERMPGGATLLMRNRKQPTLGALLLALMASHKHQHGVRLPRINGKQEHREPLVPINLLYGVRPMRHQPQLPALGIMQDKLKEPLNGGSKRDKLHLDPHNKILGIIPPPLVNQTHGANKRPALGMYKTMGHPLNQ